MDAPSLNSAISIDHYRTIANGPKTTDRVVICQDKLSLKDSWRNLLPSSTAKQAQDDNQKVRAHFKQTLETTHGKAVADFAFPQGDLETTPLTATAVREVLSKADQAALASLKNASSTIIDEMGNLSGKMEARKLEYTQLLDGTLAKNFYERRDSIIANARKIQDAIISACETATTEKLRGHLEKASSEVHQGRLLLKELAKAKASLSSLQEKMNALLTKPHSPITTTETASTADLPDDFSDLGSIDEPTLQEGREEDDEPDTWQNTWHDTGEEEKEPGKVT